MASTTTLTAGTTTAYATLLDIAEAATAAAGESVNLPSLLAAAGLTTANSPLFAGVNTAFADQAAARTFLNNNLDLIEYTTAASVGTSTTLFDANVSGAAAGNFRLVITAVKAANGDTYTKQCRCALRMSIVR